MESKTRAEREMMIGEEVQARSMSSYLKYTTQFRVILLGKNADTQPVHLFYWRNEKYIVENLLCEVYSSPSFFFYYNISVNTTHETVHQTQLLYI